MEAGIVKWPLSVLRIRHKDEKRLIDLATHVLEVWRGYTDEAAFIFAETDGEPHNTITPIARKKGDMYELDLTLRNNITTEENPLGVYHPHAQYHHIKKENIGLIEVMGLAVLPARLKEELELLAEYILEGKDIASNEKIEKHADWVKEFLPRYDYLDRDNIEEVLHKEVGNVFVHVLEDCRSLQVCQKEGRARLHALYPDICKIHAKRIWKLRCTCRIRFLIRLYCNGNKNVTKMNKNTSCYEVERKTNF